MASFPPSLTTMKRWFKICLISTAILVKRWFKICLISTALLVTVSFSIWCVFLYLRPDEPRFSITAAVVTSFNVAPANLSAYFEITFVVRNPNKHVSVNCDRATASVGYQPGFATLAEYSPSKGCGFKLPVFFLTDEAPMPPFAPDRKGTTTLRAKPRATVAKLEQKVAGGIISEHIVGSTVGFVVTLSADFRYDNHKQWWRLHGNGPSTVVCRDVRFRFRDAGTTGSLVDSPALCF